MAHNFAGTGSAETGAGLNTAAQISIAMRVYVPLGHGNALFDRVFELGGFSSGAGGLTFETDSTTSNMHVEVFTTSGSAIVATYTSFPTDQWFWVVVTSNTTGPSTHAYFNSSTSAGENTTTVRGTGSTSLCFGGATRATATNLNNCRIAEATYWEGVILSSSQVQMLLDGAHPTMIAGGNIVGHWPMVRESSPIRDVVVGNNATITGTTSVFDHPRIIRRSERKVFMDLGAALPPVGVIVSNMHRNQLRGILIR